MKIELIDLPEQPVLAIRTRTRLQDLSALISTACCQISDYLAELGEEPASAPYTAYYNQDMNSLDVEIGFPVAARHSGRGDIRDGVLPAGRAVTTLYKGAYSGLAAVYESLSDWIAKNHLEPVGLVYEYYHTGPDVPENEHVTRIVMPVR